MAKTEETKMLEKSLEERSRKKREYGCEEVTIGFKHEGHGDEIVDYMTMDANEVFRCYELKVTLSDLKTDNKLSWYGDYNYLVISDLLYMRHPDWDMYIPPYVGIMVGQDLVVKRNAKKKGMIAENREMLKNSLLRSVYWKMLQYKDGSDPAILKEKEAAYLCLQQEYAAYQKKCDAKLWTSEDFERYYAMNHRLSSYSLEQASKEERRQYMLRKKGLMTWQEDADGYVCPNCGMHMNVTTNYCPNCGIDLRK